MKELPLFVFVSSPEFHGYELILFTESPFYIFRAYRFENNDAMKKFITKYPNTIKIEGYNIAIKLEGTHKCLPDSAFENERALQHAKTFYFNNRILGNETRLKKFKI